MFVRKGQDTINDFYAENPELEWISSKKGGGDLGEAQFSLEELCDNPDLIFYVEYVATVVEFYANLVASNGPFWFT